MAANRQPRRDRAAVALVFFVNGSVFSSLFARLPAIKSELGISDGELGLALLGGAVGLLVAQLAVSGTIARLGPRGVMRITAPAYCAAAPLAALAPSGVAFALALLMLGGANGGLDVAMNVEAAAVERRRGRPLMSSFHAAFSFGALAGAGGGAIAAAAGVAADAHLAVVAVAGTAAVLAATARLADSRAGSGAGEPLFARPSRSLAALGALAFCVLLAEGSVADWSAIYLREGAGASQAVAAMGLAAFSLTMALGRLAGDGLAVSAGPRRLAAAGLALAAGGLIAVATVSDPVAGIAGFAAVGAGLATLFPLVVSAAARRPDLPPGPAIAAVSSVGYAGFLAGPPIIGLLAEMLTLRVALLLPALLCAAALALVPALGRRRERPPDRARAG
jgi:predicted MFS family arabinose efflux permease